MISNFTLTCKPNLFELKISSQQIILSVVMSPQQLHSFTDSPARNENLERHDQYNCTSQWEGVL